MNQHDLQTAAAVVDIFCIPLILVGIIWSEISLRKIERYLRQRQNQ